MTTRTLRGPWVLVLVAAGLALAPASTDNPQTRAVLDVPYSRPEGSPELRLDVVVPVGRPGPFPAVLVFYGGAWRSGTKSNHRAILDEFARRGFVAIAPEYRHCPRDRFPKQIHDAKAAVRWVRRHAAEYQIRPDRIGAMGFSAGGHLALMLGLTGPADDLEGPLAADVVAPDAPAAADRPASPGLDTRIQAVVNFFGPVDLAAEDISPASRFLVRDFLGASAAERPDLARLASPLTFVDATDPPILTFHGTADRVVPVSQASRLSAALAAAQVAGRTELLSNQGHGWTGSEQARTLEATYQFFAERLGGP